MDKEEIEKMKITPVTMVQLERILNYLVQNEEYSANLIILKLNIKEIMKIKMKALKCLQYTEKRRNNYVIRRRF